MDITTPDNSADVVINLKISGNRLVFVLNALAGMMHETKRLRFVENDTVGRDQSCDELHEVIERIRDQLSEQRCASRSDNTSGRNLKD